MREVCPPCGKENSRKKCGGCFSSFYCSQKCQAKDWPKHKKICQIFQHIVEVMKGMETESRARFINHFYAEQAMYLALKMAGIESEVSLCIVKPPDLPGDIGLPFRVCVAEGRILDVSFQFALPHPCEEYKDAMSKLPESSLFAPKDPRIYIPLPSDDDIKTHQGGVF